MIAIILSTDHAIMPEAMARSNELTIRPGAPAIGHDPIRGSGNQPGIMNRRNIVAQDLPQDLKAMVRQAHQGHTAIFRIRCAHHESCLLKHAQPAQPGGWWRGTGKTGAGNADRLVLNMMDKQVEQDVPGRLPEETLPYAPVALAPRGVDLGSLFRQHLTCLSGVALTRFDRRLKQFVTALPGIATCFTIPGDTFQFANNASKFFACLTFRLIHRVYPIIILTHCKPVTDEDFEHNLDA